MRGRRRNEGSERTVKQSNMIKLGIAFLLILALVFCVCFYSFVVRTLEEADRTGEKLVSEILLREEQAIRDNEKVLRMAGFSVKNLMAKGTDAEGLQQWLEAFTDYVDSLDESYYAVYGYADGHYLSGIGWTPGPDYDPKAREWYRRAMEADGAVAFSDVYRDAYSGRNIISLSQRINEAGDVLAVDLFTDDLHETLYQGTGLQKSMHILLDRQGGVVAHRHLDGEEVCLLQSGGYLEEVSLAAAKIGSPGGSISYTDIGGNRWKLYASEVFNGWKFVMLVPIDEVMHSAYDLITEQLIMLAAVLLVLCLLLLHHREDSKDAAQVRQIMEVLGNTYYAIYLVNLSKGRYRIIKTIYEIEESVKQEGSYWVLEKALLSLLPEESRDTFRSHYSLDAMRRQEQKSESGKAVEFKQSVNGKDKWVVCQLLRMPGFDRHHEVLLAFRTIHEEKVRELEQQKLLAESLAMARDSSRAKSDFLSRMSHDMRTPMNAIIGYTGLAKEHVSEEEKVREYLRKIDFSSKQMLSLVNDVLEMSKIEQKNLELKEEPFPLQEHAQTLFQSFADQAALRGIAFSQELLLHHSCVKGDVVRLDQILNNLLSNALKYTPAGGSVHARIEEKEQEDSRYSLFRIEVRDTGVGMSREFLDRKFRPFERENDSALRGVEGTGLGMSIVKNVVQLLNGTMEVKSEKGKGSCFIVTIPFLWQEEPVVCRKGEGLPAEPPELPQGETPEGEKPGEETLRGKRFLVVEDNEINLEILLELLEMWGCTCAAARNGREAVECFASRPEGSFDAVLMDIQMPVMNGYEAAEAIRRMERADAARVPVFAITANAFSDDVARALEAGMDGHIPKPIDFEQLKRLLLERLTGKDT